MKKSLLLIVLILVLSLLGCSKQTVQKDQPSDIDKEVSYDYQVIDSFELKKKDACDIFIGEIIDVETIESDIVFPNYGMDDGCYNLCTVKVEKSYLTQFVDEQTTIKVVNGWIEKDKDGRYLKPFEKGEKYIISGWVQPYNNKLVITTFGNMSVRVEDDGKITPVCSTADVLYKNISTLEQLEKDVGFAELCNTEATWIPEIFYNENDRSIDKEALVEDIKYALANDCELKTRKIEYDNYPNKK